jgi:D-psicose/D-tagatose/L-ribulose 3-epimerase
LQFGAGTFIWESPFSTSKHLYLVEKMREMGFDVFELNVEDPALVDVGLLKKALDDAGLKAVVCGAFGPDRDLASSNDQFRRNSMEYVQWLVDTAVTLGAEVVAGPMYSSVGKAHPPTQAEREEEWQRAVEGLQTLCAYAGEREIKLAFEPLNRFETDMINIAAQGLALIEDVGSPHLGLHLDTFHMHLEEKDSAAAIRLANKRVFHFHACENDRGIPGTGQVHWPEVAQALHDIDYQGAVVIESFTPQVVSIARAVCIWREIAPDQDSIAAEGLRFLRKLLLN